MDLTDKSEEIYFNESPNHQCIWYGICPEGKCPGDGFVNCRIREKCTLSSRMEGEYRRVILRTPKVCRIPCISFLDKIDYIFQVVSHSA